MGQRRLANIKPSVMPAQTTKALPKKEQPAVVRKGTVRKGEVFRAQRRMSDNVNAQASQHIINIPVNKSIYNGYEGKQYSPITNQNKGLLKKTTPKLRIIPIGGLGEMGIGKNMMAIEYDNDIIVIDCGFIFPGSEYPGVNYIIPDTTYLEQNKHKIRGIFFTHAHLDHIGAFPHIAEKIPAPVYGTKFTLSMVRRGLEDAGVDYQPQYIEVNQDQVNQVQVGDSFKVEFVRMAHSIPDCSALVIRTPLGVVIHSGDWRFEDKPIDGRVTDMKRLTEIASKEGVLLLLNESTNVESEGTHEFGEQDIQESIGQVMDKYPNSRVIASCFSSNIHRIQVILEEAKKHGRKVAFSGYSMIQNLEVALRTNVLKVPKDVVMKMEDIIKLPDSKITIICTGSQGELTAVLNRMASGSHRHIKIKNSDVIVFSSNPIPGNEKYVVRTVDGLMREGSNVVQNKKSHLTGIGPLHLSGHAYQDDHEIFIKAINPTYYMPIHGEFHMLVHNAELAEKRVGIKRQNIFVCDSGDILEIDINGVAKNGRIPVGGIMYDDSGAIVSEVVLKDRIHMASEGIFVVVLTVQAGSGRLLTSPDIISRGFIYLRDSEELMGLIRQYLKQKVAQTFGKKHVDLDLVKKEIKEELTYVLFDKTHRTPIVIPVINELGRVEQSGANRKEVASPNSQPSRPANGRRFPKKQFTPDSLVKHREY